MSDYHKVGDKIIGDHPAVFVLVLEEHVPYVNPKEYGIDEDGINPHNYFITSGDAVEKAKILERDLWSYAGDTRRKACELIASEYNIDISEAKKMYRDALETQNTFPMNLIFIKIISTNEPLKSTPHSRATIRLNRRRPRGASRRGAGSRPPGGRTLCSHHRRR